MTTDDILRAIVPDKIWASPKTDGFGLCAAFASNEPFMDGTADVEYTRSSPIPAMIAAAVAAERERCAKVAEKEGTYPELNVYNGGPDWLKHGKRIAAAIRKGAVE